MTALTPNLPSKRLAYIAKTYANRPSMVLDMVDIIASTVGEDNWRTAVRQAGDADPVFAADVRKYGWGQQDQHIVREPPIQYVNALVTLVQELPGFRRRHAAEGMFTWMATQLAKALKKGERQQGEEGSPYDSFEYTQERSTFARKGTALSQWFHDEKPNLTKLSFDEAMEEFEGWEADQDEDAEEVPQGDVVYEFEDGWTVQELETPEQLNVEGDVMQHCVGSYYNEVKNGNTVIYSVRDPRGRPHVTIEFDPELKFVKQIQGKQNESPAPKYQKYVDEFVESDALPQMDPVTKEVYDALSQSGQDDEYIRHDVARWVEMFGRDAIDWIQGGFYDLEEAERLHALGVEPGDTAEWPMAAWHRMHYGDLGTWGCDKNDATLESFVKLMKIVSAISRSEREEKASGPALAYAKQTKFAFVEETPEQISRSLDRSKWEWTSKAYGRDIDGDEAIALVQAERWADSDIDDVDDIEAWYNEFFTPAEAEAWEEVGIDKPEIAAVLRAERVTPEQVERAVESGRLRDQYPQYELSDLDKVLTAVGITPNRRKRW
jgi:hypothetical protein